MNDSAPVQATFEEDGALLRVVLNRPKGNVLDATMIGAIREAVALADAEPRCSALLFVGAGAHFSFGASVDEHRPADAPRLLAAFHGLFHDLVASGRTLLAAVRGQCLGGGLELAAFCHRVFAAPDAKLGNPEIRLGVFAPIASLVLPPRVGQPAADDLLLSGRVVGAEDALRMRLVDEVVDDPEAAALAWRRRALGAHSASSLGFAVRAARYGFHRSFIDGLRELEALYLRELMTTSDAHEGIAAFLEKRSPIWRHE